MKDKIVILATNTPSDMKVTIDDIQNMNSQSRYTDPLPYHYIVNIDGSILKGKKWRRMNRILMWRSGWEVLYELDKLDELNELEELDGHISLGDARPCVSTRQGLVVRRSTLRLYIGKVNFKVTRQGWCEIISK